MKKSKKESFDIRVPQNAIGYIADLHENLTSAIKTDRLTQLAYYIPDLIS